MDDRGSAAPGGANVASGLVPGVRLIRGGTEEGGVRGAERRAADRERGVGGWVAPWRAGYFFVSLPIVVVAQ